MPAIKKLPDTSVLAQLVNQGWTYAQIAERFDVGEQAVYRQMQRAGLTKPRNDHSDVIPWRVAQRHQWATPMRYLRLWGRRKHNEAMTEAEARQLDGWLAGMREADVVVAYDKDFPPNDASAQGGFYYSRRRPTDGKDSLVRMPDDGSRGGETAVK
ncbi:hypothetical protein AB0M54_45755 [Actinoplanes sp. NPDC051470]|uniref:hypothetical protein n=1 Tax=Actinoplanes sp. NPDC051470 TaxID=3157224 RepID=UPI0034192FBE